MRLLPVAADGWRFILPLLILGIGLLISPVNYLVGPGILCLGLAAFCIYFFRDFNRTTPQDESAIYSPGDGRVLEVSELDHPQFGPSRIIRIFLSVLDVHVQRAPMDGRVEQVDYKKGKFLDARHPQAHLENEQNLMTLKGEKGTLIINQIAGLIARRIVCWAQNGDNLKQGERYGLIRFGSQVDVIMPKNAVATVKPKEYVRGGLSVIAKWES